jgi:hypothetical protein
MLLQILRITLPKTTAMGEGEAMDPVLLVVVAIMVWIPLVVVNPFEVRPQYAISVGASTTTRNTRVKQSIPSLKTAYELTKLSTTTSSAYHSMSIQRVANERPAPAPMDTPAHFAVTHPIGAANVMPDDIYPIIISKYTEEIKLGHVSKGYDPAHLFCLIRHYIMAPLAVIEQSPGKFCVIVNHS